MTAITMMTPLIGRVKKIVGSPWESRSDCRMDGSAMGPRDDSEHRWRHGIVKLSKQVSDNAEDQH